MTTRTKLIKKKIPITVNKAVKQQNDLGYFNSIGGTALSVGSVKVNTVNLARLAYETLSEELVTEDCSLDKALVEYFKSAEELYLEKLKNQVILNIKCLDVIRSIIISNNKKGLLPNISDGLIELDHMYNTVGFIGVYETLKAYQNRLDDVKNLLGNIHISNCDYITVDVFGNHYYTKRAENFVKNIFKTMQKIFKDFSTEYKLNYSINCEQIPGESAADKLQKKDTLAYPDLVVKDLPVYGNQFIPLGIQTTIEERVRVAALFDSFCNGGSIAHLNFEGRFSSKEAAWDKLNWLAQQGLTYSAFTTKINACRYNHAFFGNICPECAKNGKKEGVYTQYARIVGFYTPVCTWSSKRQQEFKLREWENTEKEA